MYYTTLDISDRKYVNQLFTVNKPGNNEFIRFYYRIYTIITKDFFQSEKSS